MRNPCAACLASVPASDGHTCATVVAIRTALVDRHGSASTFTFVWNGGEYIARSRVAGGVVVECAASGLDARAVLAAFARGLNLAVST